MHAVATQSVPDSAAIVFGTKAYSPKANASNDFGTVTPAAELNLAWLAAQKARQSNKIDLGSDTGHYVVIAAIEVGGSAPDPGGTIDFYWAPSAFPEASRGNPGGVVGRDSPFNGYSGGDVSLAVQHLQFIGGMPVDRVAKTIQVAYIGIVAPALRYGSLVVFNNSSAALEQDGVEMAVVLLPV